MADDVTATSTPAPEQASGPSEGPGRGLAAALSAAFDEVGLGADEPSGTEPEEKVEPSAEGEQQAAEEEEPAKPEEGQPPPAAKVAAPQQWDAASKAKFDKLPDAAKEIVLDLAKWQERDYTKKTQELANTRRYAEAVSSLITDAHREQLRQAGLNEVQGFKRLLEYQDYALSQPKNYVRWFLQAAQLRPQDVFPEITGARPQPSPGQRQQPQHATNGAVDPQIAQIRDTLTHVTNWVAESQRERAEEVRQWRQEQEDGAKDIIQEFRSETDEGGQAKWPFFAQVEDEMTEILQSGRYADTKDLRKRLEKAYKAAVAMDEDLQQRQVDLLATQKEASKRRAADVQKAQKAKSPVSAPPLADEEGRGRLKLGDHVAKSMSDLGVS
jgi:hypothetical protein